MTSTVYLITCPAGAYIGSTQQRWSQRKAEHLYRLRKGKHCNHALQAAWDEHGEAAFEFAVLEVVADEERAAAEDKHIRACRDALNRKSSILLPRNISGARRLDARVRDLLGPGFRERLVEARSLDNSVSLAAAAKPKEPTRASDGFSGWTMGSHDSYN